MDITTFNEYFQAVAHIVTILGVPTAIYIYYRDREKERLSKEYNAYNSLDDKYIHYLEMCLNNPELDVFDLPIDENKDIKKRKEIIMYMILTSILERAFLMYGNNDHRFKSHRQWVGWQSYIQEYCKRDSFRKEWPKIGSQFNKDFVEFINIQISQSK